MTTGDTALPAGLSQGQRLDPVTGLVQPWFTPFALDEIQEWDLRDKVVLEWGGGHSTLWWATRCRQVFTIETSLEWCEWISANAAAQTSANITVLHRDAAVSAECYVRIPEACAPDIVVIDGLVRRLACLKKALTLPRPVIIIFDNWQQDNVFISAEAKTLMKPFPGVSYPWMHPAHPRHPWQTAIWRLW